MSAGFDQWYVRNRGRISGPYDFARLQGLKARGRLSRVHEVSNDRQTWLSATSIPGLFDAAQSRGGGSAQVEDAVIHAEPEPEPIAADPIVEDWYYATDAGQQGPVSIDELQQLVLSGHISNQTLVWKSSLPSWTPAAEIAELGVAPAMIAPSVTAASSGRGGGSKWILWAGISVAVLSAIAAGFLLLPGLMGDPLQISNIESGAASEQIDRAVGLVMNGWDTTTRAGKREDFTSLSVGEWFDGPYEKQLDGKYRKVVPAEGATLVSMTDRFRKDGETYNPLPEGQCLSVLGDGLEVHRLGGSGTCFMITPDGYAITNKHVIENAHQYQQADQLVERIAESEGYSNVRPMVWVFLQGEQHDAEIVHVSDDFDMAILKVADIENPAYFPLAEKVNEDTLPRGHKVYSLGFPGAARIALTDEEADSRKARAKNAIRLKSLFSDGDFDYSQHDGSISRITERDEVGMVVQHNADINPGNSGGPLLTRDGCVLAVNTLTVRGASGIHFSIAVDQLRPEIDRHVKPPPVWR